MTKIKKVLVIDDDPINNIIFEKLSDITGFAEQITACLSAVDGLDHLQNLQKNGEEAPAMIFLDIRMPIVNGWEFLQRFEKIKTPYFDNTLVYMLTSSSDQSDVNKAKNFGTVSDYIVKPLSVEVLEGIKERQLTQAH